MQLSPFLCYFIPLRSKYSPQHPVLKHPQSIRFPQCQRPSLRSTKTTGRIMVLYILTFTFLDSRWENERHRTEC
jgi:hypothetical protein